MPNIITIFPPYLILLTLILVILPTIIAILLRRSLYSYLIDSANKVSRLLTQGSRGKQPAIVDKLETRFRQASEKLEQVNTIALIDGLYSQERLNFLGISLRCEQWDYFCQTLPNLLLAFGLLGTFIGISSNLYNLSKTINQNATDVDNLVSQLQIPLQNMGIAFITSLIAIACSSILILVNLRCNTNFAKTLLISSLEDYLDNIFKIEIDGYSRLDQAVDRMVTQQQEFLTRFHEKVAQVLETTIGNAANKMVAANQGFQNNVDSMVSRFNDISSSLATSTDNFQASTFSLKQQIHTVTKIVPQFETSANKIESGSKLYLQGAEKIEASKFSEHLETLTQDLANTQKSFSQSTEFLGKQVHQISASHQQATELAEQVYTQLQIASSKLQEGANNFTKAAETFKESDFANKLNTATQELITIPQQFNQSTAILHQSTDTLGKAINKINISTQETNNLIRQVNNLNDNSTKLLTASENNLQQEIASFNNIKSELERIVATLDKHKQQINISLGSFGEKILKSFEQQTGNNLNELQKLTTEINNNSNSLQNTLNSFERQSQNNTKAISQVATQIVQLVKTIEQHEKQVNIQLNNITNQANQQIDSLNSQLSQLITHSEQQGKQVTANLSGIGIMSDRLLNSFEQRSQNNTQEITKLIKEFKQIINQLNTIPTEISQLIGAIKQHEKQINSDLNELGNNITNQANQQIQNMTEKFNKFF